MVLQFTSQDCFFSRKRFTLIEMIIVIAIIMLITGVAITMLVRKPATVILANTSSQIEKVLTEASIQASLQGKQKIVNFDMGNKTLSIGDFNPKDDFNLPPEESNQISVTSENQVRLPQDVEVEFPDFNEEQVFFSFFPDGSASGPDMRISLKGHIRLISVSHLTGIVKIKNDDEE